MKLTDDEFVAAWKEAAGSPTEVARLTGIAPQNVYARRARMERRGIFLSTAPRLPGEGGGPVRPYSVDRGVINQNRIEHHIKTGVAIVFSDAHYWPGPASLAHTALLHLIKELQPSLVVANGDVMDGARLCRQDPLGWNPTPTVKEEIEALQERMHEIELLTGKARRIRTKGNHDIRFDRYIVMNADKLEGLLGTMLVDHLPNWEECYSLYLNGNTPHPVMVKHRFNNGVHAAYNNTLRAGTSIVTGHLHRLLVTPWGDYKGRRWGVDTGCLADAHGPQFLYAEDNPSPHCSGFAVLTFKDGMLLPPELVEVIEGRACFRGQIIA